MKNILIKNASLLTQNDSNVVTQGCIAIAGDKIKFVGEESDLPQRFFLDKIIDAKSKLALPGFINTHTHTAMTAFRGYANDTRLKDWLAAIWPLEDLLTEDDVYWLSSVAIAEMISEGITTFVDMYMFMDKTAEAVETSGMRAVLGRGLQGNDARADVRLQQAKALYRQWHNKANGRVRTVVAPHALYTCDSEYLKRCVDLSHELDTFMHIHVAETGWEFDLCMNEHDLTPVQHLNEVGVFDVPTLAAHCVHVSDEDIDILLDKNVAVSYCPSSNLKLASGFAPVVDMLKAGVIVSLGTDSAASNNHLSLIKEMNLASLINKSISQDATALTPKQALTMATSNAAQAICWEDEIGSLEENMKADIILVNMSSTRYFPRLDPINSLVYSGSGADIETVLINGEIVMENKELKTLDVDRVLFETEKIKNRLYKKGR